MWALTLRQPWAWMVVHGSKDLENRSWANKIVFELLHQQKEFAIHAGLGMTRLEHEDAVAFAQQEDPELVVPNPWALGYEGELRFGQVIGTAKIRAVWSKEQYGPPGRSDHVRWHLPDRWGWQLVERRVLPFPIFMGGKQGFWKLEDALIENARRVA